MQNERENLVLVNAFYTNSILLKGLIDFLKEYLNLYFIDLPGFSKKSPPLKEVTVENFSEYIQKKINELNLGHYIIGGISFGFWVVNNISLSQDKRCKGIIALFPYIDAKSLKLKKRKKILYSTAVNFLCFTGLSATIWKNKCTQKFAYWYSSYPPDRVKVILEEMDGKTFFETARWILHMNHGVRFHKKPYILIINKDDKTIKYDYCHQVFQDNAEELFVLNSTIDHFPEDLSKNYIQERFDTGDIQRLIAFINSRNNTNQRLSSQDNCPIIP
jgi:hypothetical protein